MPELIQEDEYVESDSSDNEEQYSKLLSSVSQLDSTQRVKAASRKEITTEVSEFNLAKGTSEQQNQVNVNELAAVLRKKTGHLAISKKVKKVTEKAKTLPKPLEKPVEEKLKRSIGFEKVKNQLRKWESIVTRNSLKDHISFPLNNNSVKIHTESSDFLHQFKTSTPLEVEIAKILKKDEQPKEEDQNKEFPLTVEEMLEKRKEMAQLRARLSYNQAKAQRQSKIKSKKYHRILKREKLRQQLKEFELLQKTDPEAALKKLSELDKSRAQERASLRHRNTGHWAKNLSVRAKYDVESRKVLAEQLKMSREITQKHHTLDSSDEEEESKQKVETSKQDLTKINSIPSDNPWSVDVSEEVNNFISSYKKYWDDKNKENKEKENEESKKQSEVESGGKEIIPVISKPNEKEVQSKESNEDIAKMSKSKNFLNGECFNEVPKKVKKSKSKVALYNDLCRTKEKQKVKKNNASSISINPTSGVWIVTPVTEESEVDCRPKKKRKASEIDSLFTGLHDRLSQKAKKKINKIEKSLKRLESRENNKLEKSKKKKEFDLSFKNMSAIERPDMDVELAEVDSEGRTEVGVVSAIPMGSNLNVPPPPEIDPKKFIQVKPKKLNSQLPDNITGGEDALDDDEEQLRAIEEAFSGDDVTAEFRAMKRKEEESNQVEIKTSLPGWGSWGGEGIKPPPAKKSRKSKKSIKVDLPSRKDQNREDIIINENENPKIKEHLVKEVPHPFKSVEAFESNIRAPVGREWVPETAHRKFIKKQVTTQLGAVIEPMDEDEIIKLKAKRKTPYKGKVKEKN